MGQETSGVCKNSIGANGLHVENSLPDDPDVKKLESEGNQEAKDLQQQTEEHEAKQSVKYDTFGGVFIPTLLTILGVILFLREGWVVGNASLAGCLFSMFIINTIFSLVAIVLVTSLNLVLMQRKLSSPFGDVRSGLFSAVAEWGAKQVKMIHGSSERAWKPNILLPVEDPRRLRGAFELVTHLAYPMGSLKLLGVSGAGEVNSLQQRLFDSQQAFVDNGVFTSVAVIESDDFPEAIKVGLQAMGGTFFRPNLLLLNLPKDKATHQALSSLIQEAKRLKIGVAVFIQHDDAGLGRRKRVNLWIPDTGPQWEMEMDFTGCDRLILSVHSGWR